MNETPAAAQGQAARSISESDPPILLEVDRLRKDYGGPPVLRAVSFSMRGGEGLILLGPNGAGKSTLLRIVAGIHRPSEGRILFEGKRASFRDPDLRKRVGFVSHETFLYDALTAEENLRFFARLHGMGGESEAARGLNEAGLASFASAAVGSFSRGMAQRLTLARARLHAPSLLLLDEPFTGLDPLAAADLERSLIDFRKAGGAFLMATHDLSHAVGLAERLLIMRRGQLVHEEPMEGLTQSHLEAVYRRHAGIGVAGGGG